MWVCFADGAALGIWDVMAQNNVMEGELRCWPMGEMGDCEAGGNTPVLMEEEEVSYPRSERGGCKLRYHGIPTV